MCVCMLLKKKELKMLEANETKIHLLILNTFNIFKKFTPLKFSVFIILSNFPTAGKGKY